MLNCIFCSAYKFHQSLSNLTEMIYSVSLTKGTHNTFASASAFLHIPNLLLK